MLLHSLLTSLEIQTSPCRPCSPPARRLRGRLPRRACCPRLSLVGPRFLPGGARPPPDGPASPSCSLSSPTPPAGLALLARLCRRRAPAEPRSAPSASVRAEFSKIASATSVGFAIMGFIGFFVKLIFIPINNIIGARAAAAAEAIQPRSPPIVCSLSRCRALQSAWAEVVLLSRCMEERMDRMRGGGSLAAGFYEETREREALHCSCVSLMFSTRSKCENGHHLSHF